MNTLDGATAWLAAHGAALCIGSTIVLAAGALAVRFCRAPAQRRRLGVLAVMAAAVYLLVAALPLPRLSLPASPPARETLATPAARTTPPPKAPLPAAERAAAIERTLALLDGEMLRATSTTPSLRGATSGTPDTPWSWPPLLALGYLGGAALVLLWLVAGSLRLRLLLRSCTPVPPASLPGSALPRRVRLLATAREVRPFCAGVLRPAIVLPCSLLAPARRTEALAVIRHELAHVQNGDPFVQTLLALLAVPLFWHPLLWWLARDVRFHAELLADDAAAGAHRATYARALLSLAERAQPQLRAAGTVAVFHRPTEFFRRIQMLLQREGSLSTSLSRRARFGQALAALALVAASAGLFGVEARAQEPGALPPREAQLRDTVQTLRAELDALRQQLKKLQDDRDAAQPVPSTVTYGTLQPDGSLRPTPTTVEVLDYARTQGSHVHDFAKALQRAMENRGHVAADPLQPTPAPLEGGSDERAAAATADLTSRYLDLQAELELAETSAQLMRQRAEAGIAPKHEARHAEVYLRTLTRKLAVVDKLLAGEIAATEVELKWLAAEHERAAKHERVRLAAQIERAKTRLDAMRSAR